MGQFWDGPTDGWMIRAEFIGPSGRAGGQTNKTWHFYIIKYNTSLLCENFGPIIFGLIKHFVIWLSKVVPQRCTQNSVEPLTESH